MSSRLTLRQLYALHPDGFTIPYYQRHYVWGHCRGDHRQTAYSARSGNCDKAGALTECLLQAYGRSGKYFLQGITVAEGSRIVDGQQRLTYLYLLLRILGRTDIPPILYDNRPDAQEWLAKADYDDTDEDPECPSQDIYYYRRTLHSIRSALSHSPVETADLASYLLDNVEILYIPLNHYNSEIAIYKMMNGTKAPMSVPDVIKADLMRLASDPSQPNAYEWELAALRSRYATEWNSWVRWWLSQGVRQYYSTVNAQGLDLLIKLCLRDSHSDYSAPLTYDEFVAAIKSSGTEPYHAAKHLFDRLRQVQRRFEDAYADPTTYNRIRAIMLLQRRGGVHRFLHLYFVDCAIDADELLRYYKLSFLGMDITAIYEREPIDERFDDLLASLSMADVYHSDTKRDVFGLLLRLNIDEDIKLGRRFDFTVWDNRSLEHIYSKSKVWHIGEGGRIYDGNDNVLHTTRQAIEADKSFMPRARIVNHDGTQLSEHCIGNLVLLYGQNNASFGNATFDQKKMLFLAPGDSTVFESRNLLHTVCVFAGNSWDHRSIVDNYNTMLKNLKKYYGII